MTVELLMLLGYTLDQALDIINEDTLIQLKRTNKSK